MVGAGQRVGVVYATNGGCAPIPGVSSERVAVCFRFASQAFEFAKEQPFSTVAIAAQWYGYFTVAGYAIEGRPLNKSDGRSAALAALRSEIDALTKSGKKVYLILNIPIGPQLDPKSRVTWAMTGPKLGPALDIKRGDLEQAYGSIGRDLIDIGISAGAEIIDPLKDLCDTTVCPSVDKLGSPIYMDGNHLRAEFVRKKVRYLDKIFDDKSGVTDGP